MQCAGQRKAAQEYLQLLEIVRSALLGDAKDQRRCSQSRFLAKDVNNKGFGTGADSKCILSRWQRLFNRCRKNDRTDTPSILCPADKKPRNYQNL